MSLLTSSAFVLPLLRSLAWPAIEKGMKRAEPKVVKGMESKGMTPDQESLHDCVRDAMFRIWRAAIGNNLGQADRLRDWQDNAVVPAVLARIGATPTLPALVTATREEVLRQAKAALEAVT